MWLWALCFATSSAYAMDFGTHGPVWEVDEPNLLEVIYARLTAMEESGELSAMQQEMQDKTRAYVKRPRPVLGLNRATENRSFEVDLSITLERDLKDHRGQIFAAKGTQINPLHFSQFDKRIVVFDGDDPAQVEFALSTGNELDTLLVLINGAPLDLMRAHGRRFYFDQNAQIVDRFQIARVPSVIERSVERMRVTEIALTTDCAEGACQ